MELGDVGQICAELEYPSKCPARQQHLDRLCVLELGAVVLVAMLFLKHSFYLCSVRELRKKSVFLHILRGVIGTCGIEHIL